MHARAVAHLGLVRPLHTVTVVVFCALAFAPSVEATQRVTREEVSRSILEEYARLDCAGYLDSRSSVYRRTFARALVGDTRALRRVFCDPLFHSGDNEAWCSIPGAILYVIGDDRSFAFAMSLSPAERWWALIYLSDAAPFQHPDERRGLEFFAREFPKTHRLYLEIEAQLRPN